MGSGESDVRNLKVWTTDTVTTNNTYRPYNPYDTTTLGTYTWHYDNTIYKYQIKCPVRACKTMNWLELDKITPCVKCQTKLKAVSEQADFEVPVTK